MSFQLAGREIRSLVGRISGKAFAYFNFKRASSARSHPADDARGSGLYGVLVSRHYL